MSKQAKKRSLRIGLAVLLTSAALIAISNAGPMNAFCARIIFAEDGY
ncbi:MAG TPA: hypothetical protein VNL17_12910 [Verrucomicrobiae bacterium]|nr:hypothetical protein [Verrucomicrobiae bacterium]